MNVTWGRFATVIAIVAACTACTATYPVVGSFDQYNEVFLGQVNANLMNGTSFIDVKAKNTGARCTGGSHVSYIPASNYIAGAFLIPYCAGQKGTATLSCDDGRQVSATWTADSCTSGYGVGNDDHGARFQFAFGMTETAALERFKSDTSNAQSRPDLPDYRPKETRRQIGYSTGTGFLVSSSGYVLTNYHVIEDATDVTIIVAGKPVPATIQAVDKDNDLALLSTAISGTPVAFRQSGKTAIAEDVMTLGYPLISIQGNAQKASFGRINALSGIGDDPRYLQIDVPVQPGNSGGPLINDQGELVGVVTATLSQLAVLRATGALPQAVSYAVKIEIADNLLASVPRSNSMTKISGFKSVAETYANSVFLVIAK